MRHARTLALAALLLLTATMGAADRTWADVGSDWSDGANWNGPVGFPDAVDDLAEFNGGTVNVQPNLANDRTVLRLRFSGAGSVNLTGGSNLTIADSSAIVVTQGSHSIACGIVLGADATIQIDSGTLTISGPISGAHSLTKTGNGTLILSGANTYTGLTTVSAGTLRVASTAALGTTAAGTSVSPGAILELSGGPFVSGEALTLTGSTLSNLSGLSIWTGNVTLSSGSSLSANASSVLLITAPINNGGHLLTVTGAGSTLLTGVVSGNGGLVKGGNGDLTLSGTNTYTGTTTISAGSMTVQNAQGLGDNGGNTTTTVGNNASLILDGSIAINVRETIQLNGDGDGAGALQVGSGTPSLAGPVAVQTASTISILNAASSLTLSGALSGPGALSFQGAGTLALNNTSTSSGGLSVTNGTVVLGSATVLPSGAIHLGGTLDLNGFSPSIAGAFDGGGVITSSSNATVTFTGGGSFNGTFTGSAAASVTAGTFTYGGSATSTSSGTTSVSGSGTLVLNSAGTLGSGTSVQIGNGGTLSLGNVTIARPITFTGTTGVIATNTGSTGTLTGTLNGPAIITGSGTLNLPNASNFSSLSLTGATLQFGNAGSLGSGTVTVNSGTLHPSSALSPANALTIAGSCTIAGAADAVFDTVTINGSPVITVPSGRTHTFTHIKQGSGSSFSIAGAGTLRADLTPDGGSAINDLTVQSGATWSTNNASVSLPSLSGAGTALIGSGTLTLTGTTTFAGTIAGSGNLVSTGSVVLSGASTFTGTTTIGSGTLSLAGDTGSIAFIGSLVVNSGTTFAITNAGGSANPNRLGDSLVVTMNGGAFAMVAPNGIDRTETIGKLHFASGASVVQLTAVGAGDCQLTCNGSPAGFTNVTGATFSLIKANGSTGTANLFSTSGFADGTSIAFATGTYQIYKTTVGLDTTAITTVTLDAGNWNDATKWSQGVPTSSTIAEVRHRMTLPSLYFSVAKLVFASGGTDPGINAGTGDIINYIEIPSGGLVEIQTDAVLNGVSIYASGGAMTLNTQNGATLTVQENGVSGSTAFFYAGRLTLGGNGVFDLANTSTYLISIATIYYGPVFIEGARVKLTNVDGLPAASTKAWTLNGGAVVDLAGNSRSILSVDGGGGEFTNSGSACVLTITGGGTLNGTITGALGLTTGDTLTIQGPGSSTYNGPTVVNAGTLTVSKPFGSNGIGSGSAVTLAASADLTINGDENIGTLSLGGTNTIQVASGATLSATGAAAFSGAWTLDGGGILALAPASGSSGTGEATVIGGSTLRIARANHLGTAASVHLNVGALATQGTFTLTQAIDLAGSGNLEIGSGTLTSAAIGGPGSLTKLGSGTLIVGSVSCSQGSTSVLAGTLQVSDYRHLGAGGLTLNGGSLSVTSDLTATTGSGGTGAARTLAVGTNGGTISVSPSQTLTWPGLMSGSGALGKLGTGILVLSANNAGFSGSIAVSAGTLQSSNAGALGDTSNGTQVADGASLVVGSFAVAEPLAITGDGGGAGALQIADLASLSGLIQINAGATKPATVAVTSGTALISSRIRGAGGLEKIGAGTLTLSSATDSDFAGPVAITGGTIRVDDERLFGTASNTVTLNGGTLAVSAPVTFNPARSLRVSSADGTISTGTFTLTIPGLDTAAGQDLQILGSGGLVVNTGPSVNSTIAGAMSGTGNLTKLGAGVLSVQSLNDGGANPSFDGNIEVSAGQLRMNGSVTSSGTCHIATGAVLSGNGTLGALLVDGTVRPGGAAAAGVLTAASLLINTGATLEFDLGTANDLIAVTGSAMVATGSSLQVTGVPNAAAFNAAVGDYAIISAGSAWTYTPGDMTVAYGSGITVAASYRLIKSGTTLLLQRNRAPVVTTGVASPPGVSTLTTPPSYVVGPPGSSVLFNAAVGTGTPPKLVQATDPEAVATTAQLIFTLKLDPSQGRIDRFTGGVWQQISTDSAVSAISTWTQADIDAGLVRYISTGAVGGNDAILYSCKDNLDAESPLYLMRFTIQGSGPPVIGGLPTTARWFEESAKPGPWSALAPSATLTSGTDPLTGGLLKVSLFNGEAGDELGFNGNGVTVAGDGTVYLSGVPIGSLVATTTSLTVTLNANATQVRTAALLQAASFRTSNSAPLAVGRSIELRSNDGTIAGGTTILAFPLELDLYNDPPVMTAPLVAAVPGLARTGTVSVADPEGESAGNLTLALVQSTLSGSLAFNTTTGFFTYTPNFLPGSSTSDVLEDSFTVSATDRAFSVNPSTRRVVGTGSAARYAASTSQLVVRIRIAASGSGLAFLNVPRMTVNSATGGSFSYTPQMQLPAGAGTLTFELIDRPASVPLGSGAGQINFDPVTGAIGWPTVPDPPGSLPQYWRFGILATEPVTGAAAFLPIMLRVGPGGTNG